MRSSLSSALLVCLLSLSLLLLLTSHVSSQALTNVTGTANCAFSTFQLNTSMTSEITMIGNLTINLTAMASTVPNTPGFTGLSFRSYPITNLTGLRTVFALINNAPSLTYSSLTGIGVNRTIYLTFDPSQDPYGFPTDVGYAYRFDTTGITILTNSSALPSIRFAEVTSPTGSYSELELDYVNAWQGASFSLGPCTQNYTINPAAVTPVASSTGGSVAPSTGGAAPAGARGDPQFTGLRGQTYQVHGMADTVYSVISDRFMQLNALFAFLSSGRCPVVAGRTMTNCWSHPGSYFGSLALRTATGHRLLIEAGSYQDGMRLTLDDAALTSSLSVDGLQVTVVDAFHVEVQAGLYRLSVENSDRFLNLVRAEVLDWAALRHVVRSHGLLGQTWQTSAKAPFEGEVDDYVEADNALFGHKFLHNQFDL